MSPKAKKQTPTTDVRADAKMLVPDLNTASPRTLKFGGDLGGLVEQMESAATAAALESCGYAVLPLNPSEAALVRRAGIAADKQLGRSQPLKSSVHASSGAQVSVGAAGKKILTLDRSPMQALSELLHTAAEAALRGVAQRLQQGGDEDYCDRYLLRHESEEANNLSRLDDDDDEEDASLFSAMLSGGEGGGEGGGGGEAASTAEHEDRGLLTLITGQTEPTLEVKGAS